MTDYEQFEAWWLTKFSKEFLDSDCCWSAWTGWQARGELDAVRIEDLTALVVQQDKDNNNYAKEIIELKAKLDKAREALSSCFGGDDYYNRPIIKKALKELGK